MALVGSTEASIVLSADMLTFVFLLLQLVLLSTSTPSATTTSDSTPFPTPPVPLPLSRPVMLLPPLLLLLERLRPRSYVSGLGSPP